MWYVYILLCADKSYYIGHADDLDARVQRHNQGRGSKWTARRLPVELKYYETFTTKTQASRRETQRKKWSRIKKQPLISADIESLKKSHKSQQSTTHPARNGNDRNTNRNTV